MRAERRVLVSALFAGAGFGLALGALLLVIGLGPLSVPKATVLATAQPMTAADPVANAGATPVSARDLDCLTQAVYFEARGETARGQAAVAQVVLNRVRHPAYPKTVCAVVYQRAAYGAGLGHGCQFSFACDGSMRRTREEGAWLQARRIAARALSGAVFADVGGATAFHTTAVSPAWGDSMLRVAQVGLHVFYKPGRPRIEAEPEPVVLTKLETDGVPPRDILRMAMALSGKAAEKPPVADSAADAGQPTSAKVSASS